MKELLPAKIVIIVSALFFLGSEGELWNIYASVPFLIGGIFWMRRTVKKLGAIALEDVRLWLVTLFGFLLVVGTILGIFMLFANQLILHDRVFTEEGTFERTLDVMSRYGFLSIAITAPVFFYIARLKLKRSYSTTWLIFGILPLIIYGLILTLKGIFQI